LIKSEKYIGFDDTWLIVFGIPFFTVLVNFLIFGVDGFTKSPIPCLILGLMHTSVYWFLFRKIIISYHKRYPDYEFTIGRLFYVISWTLLMFLVVHSVLAVVVDRYIHPYMEIDRDHDLEAKVVSLTMLTLAFFVYEGIYYFNRSRKTEIEKNKLEKITAEQKLSTLKNQVNPHFLFNSLNTLMTMIPEEPSTAVEFVQELSKSYRNILEVRNEKLITIRQELKALDSYIYLLKTRFQGKIHIYNSIDDQIKDNFILPISLQILIENSVKHNITSATKPLKIELSNKDDYIIVKNNLQKKDQNYSSTKLGLANIRSRYKLLIEQDIHVIETRDEFIVKLPIIRNQLHEDIID